MEFRTVFQPKNASFKIDHRQKIMLIGSCFSEHIGDHLKSSGFRVMNNPFGVMFNPDAIRNCLRTIGTRKKFRSKDFFQHNGLWHSFQLHGDLSNPDLEEAIFTANSIIDEAYDFLLETDVLILTFGTAWVYEYNETGKRVANCHKVPNSKFTKVKMGVNDIISEMSWVLNHIQNVNPNIKVIFTISPVRHLADGFVENQWSKSTLNIAVHELIRRFENAEYFPSYELLMDDLRDYRFYEADMIHPNKEAIQYTWSAFKQSYFSAATIKLSEEAEKYHRSLLHRVMHPGTTEHKKFVASMEKDYQRLQKQLPWL